MELKKLFDTAVEALQEKKGRDIKAIDISNLTTIAHYFILCSGTSVTHIKSLSDSVEEKLGELGIKPRRTEGYSAARWVLMDYSDIVIHIFHEEEREFYGLERLWHDGIPIKFEIPV